MTTIRPDRFKPWINPSPMGRGSQMWIVRYEEGKEFILDVQGMKWDEVPPSQDWPPTLRLIDDDAQDMMDALWRCGYRPTAGKQSEGQVKATEAHLKDMRAIVAKKLDIQLP